MAIETRNLFGGGGLIMPQISIGAITMKTLAGTVQDSNDAGFFTAIDLSHTEQGYESVSLTAAADTTEQTVVDITGSEGVLTHAMAPELAAGGVSTIRVTIDGAVTTFTSEAFAGGNVRFCAGHFPWVQATVSPTNNAGFYGSNDAGYEVSGTIRATISTPNQAILSLIGMKFTDSLKVTVQGSTAITATTDRNKAVVCYLTSIPEGV